MSLFFSILFAFATSFATPNLFDHATKNYTNYLENQSPEKAKLAQTIANAAKLIKETETTEKKDGNDEQDVECDEKTFDEFRLICAKNGSPLLEKINPKTAIGFTHLIKLLAKPTNNTEELEKRQKIIRFFIENPDITAKIQELLSDLQKEEAFLLDPYKKYASKNKAESVGIFSFLLGFNFLALKASYKLGIFRHTSEVDSCVEYMSGYCQSASKADLNSIKSFFKYENTQDLLYRIKTSSNHVRYDIAITSIIVMFSFGVSLWNQAKVIKSFKDFAVSNLLTTYISDIFKISQRINNQKSFFKLIESLQEIQPSIPHQFCSLNTNKSFLTKITNLNTSISSHTNYCIDMDGTLIPVSKSSFAEETISTELHPQSDFLKKLYFDIGLLDAYTALAQLYTKHNGQFVDYSNSINPIIDIKGGLHPNIIGSSKAITNDFLHRPGFGKPVTICSGKNGSGKSFNTKTIILLTWLSQTITFTLTEKPCLITPFDYFKIHANISDSDYYSKFETEKNELAKLLEKITTLEQNKKKSFVLFDEPLSTTSSTLAEPILKALISILQDNKHSLAFIITHLHAILAIKDIRQMSIKVTQNNDGTFTSTRKFQEGPSYDNDAAQLLAQTLNPTLRDLFLQKYENEVKKIQERNSSSLCENDAAGKNDIADSDKN